MRRLYWLLGGGALALLVATTWDLLTTQAPAASGAHLASRTPLTSGTPASSAAPNVEAGKALFTGSVPLQARMLGHDIDLPPSAVCCANCHVREEPPAPGPSPTASAAASASAGPVERLGPPLTRRSLLSSLPRRGGPPSRYELGAFCRLLRVGIDPASVVIPGNMPRYQV